jgi:uncharacterized Ntn-hydrolase superfamily protein
MIVSAPLKVVPPAAPGTRRSWEPALDAAGTDAGYALAMTFSLVARDPETGELGVAVASRFLAVGAVVPVARAGIGAVATQALANVAYGPDGLALLADGVGAVDVVARLTQLDPHRDHRQLGIVDAGGGAATFTGSACSAWAGGRIGPGCAAQGNILAGAAVVDALLESYLAAVGPFADRLLAALLAADRAGGDRRGRQSAALLVVRDRGGYLGADDRWLDLRVDDHPDPVAELARLRDLHRLLWEPVRPEELVAIDESLAVELQELLGAVGAEARGPADDEAPLPSELVALFPSGPTIEPRPYPAGWDDAWQARLVGWMGMENLEGRMVAPGWVDRATLEHLRETAVRGAA